MKFATQNVLAMTALLALLSSGCGSKQAPPTAETVTLTKLNEVGELYRVYSLTFKKPPKSKAEVTKVENSVPSGLTPINTGDIIVFWGGELTDLGEEPGSATSDKILAYEKEVPEKGGKVLTLDRR
ncbi:MAG: hypothetical protein ACKO0V_21150, partial [bacterium]